MAFKKIDKIILQGGEAGEAFGGYIYAMTVQMGYTSGPTKVTLNIVNNTGTYQPRDASGTDKGSFKDVLNTSDIWDLKVGELDEFKLHLISYNIKTSVNQRVLSLQFVDTSVILDKVFVGLINRHVKVADIAKGEAPVRSRDGQQYGVVVDAKVDLKLNCMKCDGTSDMMLVTPGETVIPGTENSDGSGGTVFGKDGIIRRIAVVQSNGKSDGVGGSQPEIGKGYVEPSKISFFKTNGGMIILGRESFVEQKCDIPEVDYNFSDLIYALNQSYTESKELQSYIQIASDPAGKKLSLQDRNENYRNSYTGTLREVLNAWCSDMAYSFTWDLSKQMLVGIDLSKEAILDEEGIKYIDRVKKAVSEIVSKGKKHPSTIVEAASESGSIEGTYKAGYVSQYIKPARMKEDITVNYKVKQFYNVPVEAITTWQERGYMPIADFMVTCALAKYSKPLRELYLHEAGVGNAWVRNALGITWYMDISSSTLDQIITNSNDETYGQILRKFEMSMGGAVGRFVIIDDDAKGSFDQWQSELASGFIGQYYYSPMEESEIDSKSCKPDSEIKFENEVVAGGDVGLYALDKPEHTSLLPYAQFMNHPESHSLHKVIPYIDISAEGSEGYDPTMFTSGPNETFATATDYGTSGTPPVSSGIKRYSKRVYMFQKGAAWGINEFTFSKFMSFIPMGDVMPQIYELSGTSKAYLTNLLIQGKLPTTAKDSTGNTISMATAIKEGTVKMLISGRRRGMAKTFRVLSNPLTPADKFHSLPDHRVYARYFRGLAGNPFEPVYKGQGEQNAENDDKCVTNCESSLVEEICGVCDFDGAQNRPFVGYPQWTGTRQNIRTLAIEPIGPAAEFILLYSHYAEHFEDNFIRNESPAIMFPVMAPYQGYIRHANFKKTTVTAKKEILGFPLPEMVTNELRTSQYGEISFDKPFFARDSNKEYSNNTMGIKVVENLITNDADAALEYDDPDKEGIIQVAVPATNSEIDAGPGKAINLDNVNEIFSSLTLEEYHKRLYDSFKNNAVSTDDPVENFNFTLAGLEFKDKLKDLLDPAKGLTNLGVSLDDSGVSVDISYATRPPEYPKSQVYMKKIEPKLNVFGR
jgi:hypothetical protein